MLPISVLNWEHLDLAVVWLASLSIFSFFLCVWAADFLRSCVQGWCWPILPSWALKFGKKKLKVRNWADMSILVVHRLKGNCVISLLLSCLWSLLLQPEHDPPFHVLFHPYWIYSLFTGFTWLFVLPYLEHVQLSQVLLNQAFAFTPWGLNDIISHLQGWGLQFPWIICDTSPQSF